MWEKLDDNSERLRVPGGWIVRSYIEHYYGVSVHQIYIKDTNHTWIIKSGQS